MLQVARPKRKPGIDRTFPSAKYSATDKFRSYSVSSFEKEAETFRLEHVKKLIPLNYPVFPSDRKWYQNPLAMVYKIFKQQIPYT